MSKVGNIISNKKKIEINLKRRVISNSQAGRGTRQRTINKLKNTLSKQIQFYLHSPIKIKGVLKNF
jgi:hypothetical protein